MNGAVSQELPRRAALFSGVDDEAARKGPVAPKVATNISSASNAGRIISRNLHRTATAPPPIRGLFGFPAPPFVRGRISPTACGTSCADQGGEFRSTVGGTSFSRTLRSFFGDGWEGVRFSEGRRWLPRAIRDPVYLKGRAGRPRLDAYESSVAIARSK